MRGESEFKEETKLYQKTGHLDDRKCGICGGKAELGPFCGGPYCYYCKLCHKLFIKIIGDYLAHIERTGFAIYHKRGFFKSQQKEKSKREEG